jgi:DNA-binding transcriptional LysR family regulator
MEQLAVGRTDYDCCARIVGEIEDAERAVSRLSEAPRGILRVTTAPQTEPPAFPFSGRIAPLGRGWCRKELTDVDSRESGSRG